MWIKRLLLTAPLLCLAVVLQSGLWLSARERASVNHRDTQRLHTYTETASADAKTLNPILHADTASGRIVDLMFEGLLELGEDLTLRGRLASQFELGDEVTIRMPDRSSSDPATTAQAVERLQRIDRLLIGGSAIAQPSWTQHIQQVKLQHDSHGHYLLLLMNAVVEDLEKQLNAWLASEAASTTNSNSPGSSTPADQTVMPSTDLSRNDTVNPHDVPLLVEHHPIARFTLRQGVQFHDGHTFDANDVLFTYDALMLEANLSPRRSSFEPIERVQAIDSHHVQIRYKRLYSQALSIWTIGILPEHVFRSSAQSSRSAPLPGQEDNIVSAVVRKHSANARPIGTGAFRFVEWQPDERITLKRFHSHWQDSPGFETVHIRVIPDTLSRELEFRSGAADVYVPEPHQADRYRSDSRYQLLDPLRMGYTYIAYNMRRSPFDDPRVRKALGMAIDVDQLVASVLFGEGVRVTGPYPISTPYYFEQQPPLPFDPQRARELLDQAGYLIDTDGYRYKNGKPLAITLITNNGNARRKAVLSIVQNAWKHIGVRCQTRVFEWSVFLADYIDKSEFDAVVLGWSLGVDPDLHSLWHSSQTDPKELNFVGYKNPRVDQWLEGIRQTSKLSNQVALAHQIHRQIAADQPYTFLFAPRATHAFDKRIMMLEDESPARIRAAAGNVYHFFQHWLRPQQFAARLAQ